jgi:hypothetical protein
MVRLTTLLALGVLAVSLAALPLWVVGDLRQQFREVLERAAGERKAQRQRAYAAKSRVILGRIGAKEGVLDEALVGGLPLLEAAARFRDLDRVAPARRTAIEHLPDESDAEYYCRTVLDWASLVQRSEASPEAVRRLETERDEHRRHGTLALRPPAPVTIPLAR